MADRDRRVVEVRRVEFAVPTNEPWGADWTELSLAIRRAHNELWGLGRYPEGKDVPSDAIRVFARDDEIVVSYIVERSEGSDEWR